MSPGAWEMQPRRVDLLLGIIHTGIVTFDWALEYARLQKYGATMEQSWRGLPFDVGRNRLVMDARECGARYIFMLDSDCIAARPDAIIQLINLQLPVVSGLYWSKQGCPGIWGYVPANQKYAPYTQLPQNSLMEVDAAGAGALLIDMRVFDVLDQMGLPWFKWTISDPKKQEGGCYSEDFNFFRSIKAAGLHAYCHTGIQFFHEETPVCWNAQGQRQSPHVM